MAAIDPGWKAGDAVLEFSQAERRFEWWRRTGGLFLGPVAFAALLALPLPGLSDEAHRLAAIVSLVVAWWVTEAIPVAATALLGAALTVVMGVASAQDAFAPFASPTIFLFLGSFILAEGIAANGLDRRLAFALLRSPWLASSPGRVRLAAGLLAGGLSMWMSNTATAAMLLPVVLGLLGGSARAGGAGGSATGFLLVLAYSASIGGVATPVGTPPNLIAIGMLERLAGRDVDFFRWMALGVPLAAAMYAALTLIVRYMYPAAQTAVQSSGERESEWGPTGPLGRGEKNAIVAFGTAVILWITPGVTALAFGTSSAPYRFLSARLDEGVVALLAALLLFVLPVDWQRRQFTVTWAQASRIDWGTILLFGGGLSLGRLMFTSGLAEKIGIGLVSASGAHSLWTITAVMCAVAILMTEVTSNTAATNMLVPVALAISQAAGVSPLPPVLAVTFGASMAFMLPISTPPNAIVYGSGLVPITAMIRCGLLLDLVSFAIIVLGLRLLCPVLGLL
ncbi:MAG: SLC13/DASS family transporter [Acidobacteria bacterium]|nr:MAG: SLC13/DASS family transporter [Acidobacteriota bacterium]